MKESRSKFQIRISIITWNLAGGLPQQNQVIKMFEKNQDLHNTDLLCFATQQCQRSLCMSFICQDKSAWENDLIQILNNIYKFQCSNTMQGLHIAIFSKRQSAKFIQQIQKDNFRTLSIGGKGAISISLILQGFKVQFINCHLPANQGQSTARNQAILTILQKLVDPDMRTQVFLCGDLNYRIDMDQAQYKKLISEKKNTDAEINYEQFLNRDQIKNQQVLKKSDFNIFEEKEIRFPPTYKLDPNGDQYSSSRIPGWTDRVFHRAGRSQQISYTCQYNIKGSDHRPVIASYELTVEQTLSAPRKWNFLNLQQDCQII